MKNDLKNKLDALGSTPIEEQELGNFLLNERENEFADAKTFWALVCDDLIPSDYENEEIFKFMKDVEEKILSFEDKDGNLKSTETTRDVKPLPFFDAAEYKSLTVKRGKLQAEIMTVGNKLNQLIEDMRAIPENDEKKLEEFNKKTAKRQKQLNIDLKRIPKQLEELNEKIETIVFSQLDSEKKEAMMDWEKTLYSKTVDMLVVNPEKTVQGKK